MSTGRSAALDEFGEIRSLLSWLHDTRRGMSAAESSQLGMARKLADLAQHLDEAKFGWPVEMHAQALACAETMYDMVAVLAGDRVDEIIGAPDGSEEPRRLPGGREPNCNGGPGWVEL